MKPPRSIFKMATFLFGFGRLIRRRVTSFGVVTFFALLTLIVLINNGQIAPTPYPHHDDFAKKKVDEMVPPSLRTRNKRFQGEARIFTEGNRSHNLTYFPMDVIRKEQQARIAHLQQECTGRRVELAGLTTHREVYGDIEANQARNYLYCPILKVGSTFFRRVFYAMRLGKALASPYEIGIHQALRSHSLNQLSQLDPRDADSFLSNATSVMFVREPFARLLSGFTDKLFAPNPYFWEEIGQHIIKTIRYNSSGETSKEKMCGHDVSFSEFIKYVIISERTNSSKRDGHFSPAYDKCKPCSVNYNVIGKMESFSSDVAYALHLLDNPVSKEALRTWSGEATSDAVYDSIYSPFGWKEGIKQCISWRKALQRIWRKLQIRCIILLEDAFPWASHEFISYKTFMDTINMFHSKADKEELRKQKLAVLAEAYSLVEPTDIEAIIEVFKPDFQLFQYDQRPKFMFNDDFVQIFRNKNTLFDIDSI